MLSESLFAIQTRPANNHWFLVIMVLWHLQRGCFEHTTGGKWPKSLKQIVFRVMANLC
jgi:hypothetical protein